LPKITGEDRISISCNGTGDAMEVDHLIKEGMGNRHCCVWVARRNEVCILREPIYNCHHHCLTSCFWKSLNKIHCNVNLNRMRNIQRLQQPCWMQVLCFVALTNRACPNELPHQPVVKVVAADLARVREDRTGEGPGR
jgi:hypothetical protein